LGSGELEGLALGLGGREGKGGTRGEVGVQGSEGGALGRGGGGRVGEGRGGGLRVVVVVVRGRAGLGGGRVGLGRGVSNDLGGRREGSRSVDRSASRLYL
jgi:hypothetical protein